MIVPQQLPVGVLTALIGVLIFLGHFVEAAKMSPLLLETPRTLLSILAANASSSTFDLKLQPGERLAIGQ